MKNVLVTGGARGIGLEIASAFLNDEDYFVIIGDNNRTSLQDAQKALRSFSDKTAFIELDISKEKSVGKAFEEIQHICKGIDILINNAGISPKHNGRALNLEELSLDEWKSVVDVNLTGAFLCTQKAVKYMRGNNWGRIVFVSSQTSRTAAKIAGIHYATTKTALLGFSRQVASQYGQFNITSNCIAPGRIESDMTLGVSDEANKKFLENTPIKRMGTQNEVAKLVKYLASEDAGYITGTVVDINGGAFMG